MPVRTNVHTGIFHGIDGHVDVVGGFQFRGADDDGGAVQQRKRQQKHLQSNILPNHILQAVHYPCAAFFLPIPHPSSLQ